MITCTPLTDTFGVLVDGLTLSRITDAEYADLRALFEEHGLLLFKDQPLTDDDHIALARRFGPIEDRNTDDPKVGKEFKVPVVSNVREDGSVTGKTDLHTLNLKAIMLWHADRTFLPISALVNILTARVVTQISGHTEFASTRAGWNAMPETLKTRVRGTGFSHHLAHSRNRVFPELGKMEMFHKWPQQLWQSVWINPVNGREALYVASPASKVDGMSEAEGAELIDELRAWVAQPQFVYSHKWTPNDVMIWDQRAVLHRATPWDYNLPRQLSSICVSATSADGVDAMRMNG